MQRSIEGMPIFMSGNWIRGEDLMAPAEVRKEMMICEKGLLPGEIQMADEWVTYILPERQEDDQLDGDDFKERLVFR